MAVIVFVTVSRLIVLVAFHFRRVAPYPRVVVEPAGRLLLRFFAESAPVTTRCFGRGGFAVEPGFAADLRAEVNIEIGVRRCGIAVVVGNHDCAIDLVGCVYHL